MSYLMMQGRWQHPNMQHDAQQVPKFAPLLRIADKETGALKMVSLDITRRLLSEWPCIHVQRRWHKCPQDPARRIRDKARAIQRFLFVMLREFSGGTRIVQRVRLGVSHRINMTKSKIKGCRRVGKEPPEGRHYVEAGGC